MSRKRRIFDIEMPDESTGPSSDAEDQTRGDDPQGDGSKGGNTPGAAPEEAAADLSQTFPAGKTQRRGPMATAITEAAQSARERQDIEARIRAENDALAHEHVRLKKLGLVMEMIPLDQVETWKLTRDRTKGPDPELPELTESIRTLGLSNPIRLEARSDGRYELIQGYRRLGAYRALLEETGDDDRWGTIPAVVAEPGEQLERLYRLMVDENLVRKDISFYEMAQLALDYAGDPQTEESDADKVVAQLFASAGYQKRSYIRGFIKLVERVGDLLRHGPAIPRRLGLTLVQKLEVEPALVQVLREDLKGWDDRSAADELDVLRRLCGAGDEALDPPAPKPAKAPGQGRAKTSFQLDRREGRAKCTAANGRLEIRLPRDFTMIDRRKLEDAVNRLLDQLD
ncbi:ParB/RepB/Spo0J family partition protein [Acidimangrovimonas sediminis]|uniref:ParB/RepB/Spo0J family partition protein n=1 Tax=Acidimangrovimonas sediminis TaxID=2056283 RepID=UPI000C80BB34|nr:ParB N-terminal domain-containing protein [Acidimangrovimonas sediminis]